MNARVSSPELAAAASQDDRARADFYALISRLFYAGPDTGLLAAIAGADEIASEDQNSPLAQTWRSLVSAAAAMDAEAAREEYDSVFIGTGKAEITPYVSYYIAQSMKESVLVRLRAELAEMGLARERGAAEYEDHFSGLCEVMRHLILLDSSDVEVQTQKAFFMAYVAPCYSSFCAAVIASPKTNFYRHVARFTKAFLDVELDFLEMN
jgi:TorA maturation chaperone TorD